MPSSTGSPRAVGRTVTSATRSSCRPHRSRPQTPSTAQASDSRRSMRSRVRRLLWATCGPVSRRTSSRSTARPRPHSISSSYEFGDWLLLGKTYSTFMDDAALPTTLDYNGPSGMAFARQWLARVSIPFASGWAIEASVEDPQADPAGGAALLHRALRGPPAGPRGARALRRRVRSCTARRAFPAHGRDGQQRPFGTRERDVRG